jgi:hypothetical protein
MSGQWNLPMGLLKSMCKPCLPGNIAARSDGWISTRTVQNPYENHAHQEFLYNSSSQVISIWTCSNPYPNHDHLGSVGTPDGVVSIFGIV